MQLFDMEYLGLIPVVPRDAANGTYQVAARRYGTARERSIALSEGKPGETSGNNAPL